MIIAQGIKDNSDKIDYFNEKINLLHRENSKIENNKKDIINELCESEIYLSKRIDAKVSMDQETNNKRIKLRKTIIDDLIFTNWKLIKDNKDLSNICDYYEFIITLICQLNLYIVKMINQYYVILNNSNIVSLTDEKSLLEDQNKKEFKPSDEESKSENSFLDKINEICGVYRDTNSYLGEIKLLYSEYDYFKIKYKEVSLMFNEIMKKMNVYYKDNVEEIHNKIRTLINQKEINGDTPIERFQKDYKNYIDYPAIKYNLTNVDTAIENTINLIKTNNTQICNLYGNNGDNKLYEFRKMGIKISNKFYVIHLLFKKNSENNFVKSNETIQFEKKLQFMINKVKNLVVSKNDKQLIEDFNNKIIILNNITLPDIKHLNFESEYKNQYEMIQSTHKQNQFF